MFVHHSEQSLKLLVFFVMHFSIFSAVVFLVFKSESQNTGVAPPLIIAFAEATHVKLGTITSSVFLRLFAFIDNSRAEVHEFKLKAYLTPKYFAKFFSNK